jgi:hypothetical protein
MSGGTHTDRQQTGDLISLLSFLEIRLIISHKAQNPLTTLPWQRL